MSRKPLDPLRPLTDQERRYLAKIARAAAAPAVQVARAKALLAVAQGQSYTATALAAGRKSGDAVAHLVSRFNQEGLTALRTRPVPGRKPTYSSTQRELVLAAARRKPEPATDGTATWSLTTLQQHLQANGGGLEQISTVTIWAILRQAGFRWQQSRTWCATGSSKRKRKAGIVTVTDPHTEVKKN